MKTTIHICNINNHLDVCMQIAKDKVYKKRFYSVMAKTFCRYAVEHESKIIESLLIINVVAYIVYFSDAL